MSEIYPSRPLAAAVAAACLFGLAGCDHFDVREAAGHLPPYQKPVDRPKTIIDTALDACPDKTEEQEPLCVKQALADRHTSVAALAAMVQGCRVGQECHYSYKTDDRLGYVPAMAEDFVIHWSVGFDLRHAGASASDVPITVTQVE